MALLFIFMVLSAIAGNLWLAAFWFALMGVRQWLYQRSKRPQCPSCKSRDCVPADSPAGQRIITQTKKV